MVSCHIEGNCPTCDHIRLIVKVSHQIYIKLLKRADAVLYTLPSVGDL